MPHRYGEPGTIKRAKETIAFFQNLIHNAQAVKRGDVNSIKAGMEHLRELEFDAGFKKDQHLVRGTAEDFIKAHGFHRMQEAYLSVLKLFEAPDDLIDSYKGEIQKYQAWLNKYDRDQNTERENS